MSISLLTCTSSSLSRRPTFAILPLWRLITGAPTPSSKTRVRQSPETQCTNMMRDLGLRRFAKKITVRFARFWEKIHHAWLLFVTARTVSLFYLNFLIKIFHACVLNVLEVVFVREQYAPNRRYFIFECSHLENRNFLLTGRCFADVCYRSKLVAARWY